MVRTMCGTLATALLRCAVFAKAPFFLHAGLRSYASLPSGCRQDTISQSRQPWAGRFVIRHVLFGEAVPGCGVRKRFLNIHGRGFRLVGTSERPCKESCSHIQRDWTRAASAPNLG